MTDTKASAQTLRDAAALMRERAQAATPGPWLAEDDHGNSFNVMVDEGGPGTVYIAERFCQGHSDGARDAEYVASWPPEVALAVADWLEREAALAGLLAVAGNTEQPEPGDTEHYALTVARAYLGAS